MHDKPHLKHFGLNIGNAKKEGPIIPSYGYRTPIPRNSLYFQSKDRANVLISEQIGENVTNQDELSERSRLLWLGATLAIIGRENAPISIRDFLSSPISILLFSIGGQ